MPQEKKQAPRLIDPDLEAAIERESRKFHFGGSIISASETNTGGKVPKRRVLGNASPEEEDEFTRDADQFNESQ